ncbi:unnamed protein product [Strongylus vulgaris]|uniref:Uncharacterized protein n=1 Tax=Strongylus vulgaris TaxID=40348 RepID=A0A3P7KQM8_STRVU|nr:unnamed protein product [Strongylus vulgaris]
MFKKRTESNLITVFSEKEAFISGICFHHLLLNEEDSSSVVSVPY